MGDRLLRLGTIGAGDKPAVRLLLAQSLLLGIFYGTFDVTAHSIFLSVFDEKMMAKAYIISGLAGIILTSLYSRYYNRMTFRNLAIVTLSFITAVTLALWILLLGPARWAIFMVFIFLGPLNILAILSFNGILSHLQGLRRSVKLSGLIHGAMITGVSIGCFAITVLVSAGFELRNVFLISSAAVLAVTVIQAISGKRYLRVSDYGIHPAQDAESHESLSGILRKNRYAGMLAAFTVFSVMTAFFVQYSFMAVTRIQYPSMENMAHFLGLFTGSMMIFTLIVRFLVFPYLIRNFGLPVSLAVSPFMIAALTVAVVVTGLIMGYHPAATGLTLFFILLALSRLFSRSLKESVETVSLGIASREIDGLIRQTTGTGMGSIINEIAALLSGLVLAGLGSLGFIKLIHFPLVLIVITLLWIFLAFRLYLRYRESVRKTSRENAGNDSQEITWEKIAKLKNRISAEMRFANDYFGLITGDLSPLEAADKWYLNNILDHADLKKDINLLPALKKIKSGSSIEREIRQRSAGIIPELELILSGGRPKGDRFNAMMTLSDSCRPQTSEVLKLLRDKNSDLKKIALCLIRKHGLNEILPEVCECLGNPELEVQASDVLKSFRGGADQAMRRYYLLSSGNLRISKTILRLLGANCNSENEEFLLPLLWSGPRQTREAALKSLAGCDYEISEEEKERLFRLISDITGIITWNLSAGICIKGKENAVLIEALDKENERWALILFDLLSITYDAGSVKNIRENIKAGTVESINHALEIIHILFDEPVKAKLIPLFDNLSDRQKLKTLFRFYPGEIPDYDRLIEDMINRDYNLLGVWVRACIIRNMPEIKDDMTESLMALLFSPELILREETAKLLSRSGKENYRKVADRIPVVLKGRLEDIINAITPDRDLLYDKVKFIESLFRGLPEENLLYLASELRYAETLTPVNLPLQGGYILWECNCKTNDFKASIFYDNILKGIRKEDSDTFCYILPLTDLEVYLYQFPEHSYQINNYIDEIE